MTIYRDASGNEYELPKLTLKLAEEMAAVPSQNGVQATAKAMYAFVGKVLPEDYIKDALDGSKLEDVDLVALRNIYDAVDSAYTSAMEDGTIQQMTDRLETVAPMIDTMDKVMNINDKAMTRQGFKKVK